LRGTIVAATQGRPAAVQEAGLVARQLVEHALPAHSLPRP